MNNVVKFPTRKPEAKAELQIRMEADEITSDNLQPATPSDTRVAIDTVVK